MFDYFVALVCFAARTDMRLILREAVSFLITPLLTEAMTLAVNSRKATSMSFDFSAKAVTRRFSTVLICFFAWPLRAVRLIV